ncbi:MAG: TatD family hydrolase [Planctomycetota bacterium]
MDDRAIRLIDIGANLTDPSFDRDRLAVLDRAKAAGVVGIVATGADLDGSRKALALAGRHEGFVFGTAGIHPHHARNADDAAIAGLRALAEEPAIVAIGECGLDFYRDLSPRPDQERCFEAQIELASETGLPLFVHDREAASRVLPLIAKRRDALAGVVVHCFTGCERELRAYLDLGCHIGITGWICDERRGSELRRIAGFVPLDHLMLETDAPYLIPGTISPKPRTRRNEPSFLPWVLAEVARCSGRAPEEVARATTENAQRFFGLTRASRRLDAAEEPARRLGAGGHLRRSRREPRDRPPE